MNTLLHDWILGLTTACMVTACALAINKNGPVSRVTRLVCGVVLTAVLFSPLAQLDMDAYSLSLAGYRNRVAELTGELSEAENRLNRLYIEAECAAYILDEAHALGTEGRVEVRAKWRDSCWVPWEARLTLGLGEEARRSLCAYMEAQLGIPAERQYWE